MDIGTKIHKLAEDLWGYNRSITGDGVRKTLYKIKETLSDLNIYEVPSGTKVFDWEIPEEWNVSDAYIITPSGEKICDFKENNLHLVGYSIPINLEMTLEELQQYLYSDVNHIDAIPYVTSYFEKRWGFCISHEMRSKLTEGLYKVVINSELKKGSMTYADIIIPGKSDKEVLISTYICHPSMANNELSGPVISSFIAQWLEKENYLNYSYRFVFAPETIGSIFYINKNLQTLKSNVIAGFNLTCIGDERAYSYLQSRNGNTLSDKIALHVLKWTNKNFKSYSWSERGSSERQYCSPGIDLPMVTLCRSKFGEYSEYHTSKDDLVNVVTAKGLGESFLLIKKCIEAVENNIYFKASNLCEPNLGKRGLYPTLSIKNSYQNTKLMMDILTYADGQHTLFDIAEICNVPIWELYEIKRVLEDNDLITNITNL